MSSEDQIKEVVDLLTDLNVDASIPKNVKLKIGNVIDTLKEKGESSIRVNKVLNELDDVANDTNIEQYVRTQIWSIVSILENI